VRDVRAHRHLPTPSLADQSRNSRVSVTRTTCMTRVVQRIKTSMLPNWGLGGGKKRKQMKSLTVRIKFLGSFLSKKAMKGAQRNKTRMITAFQIREGPGDEGLPIWGTLTEKRALVRSEMVGKRAIQRDEVREHFMRAGDEIRKSVQKNSRRGLPGKRPRREEVGTSEKNPRCSKKKCQGGAAAK